MTDLVSPAGSPTLPARTRATRTVRSSLRTRIRVYAVVGALVVGGWLYYTIQSVLGLYDATLQTTLYTDLRQRVTDAMAEVQEGSDSLDRYLREGQGYDLASHYRSRTELKGSIGAIRRQPLPVVIGGTFRRAEAASEVYDTACERAVSTRSALEPGRRLAIRDNEAFPAASNLREVLGQLEREFARRQDFGELQLRGARNAATAALVILAGLILVGLVLLVADVNRRILVPCSDAARALEDLVAGRSPARLSEASNDEIGALGSNFNAASRVYFERGRALEARDIESSVNAVLVAAATVNDLAGFGTKVLGRVIEVTGASSAVLYLADGKGDLHPAVSVGGAEGTGASGRDEARRAMREQKPFLVSVDAQTPTVDLFDGRILPRESLHVPLLYFGEVVGVLGLGAVTPFTDRARNTLTAIAPSLAVALANASANERLAEQSRRLAEQNELLEEQRSRIARTARELQRASALKDRFLAAVSHELRTPMTVILGFTGTLLRGTQGPLTDAQRESLERVQRNARLLLGLINDVLDISKIESGKAEIRREVVSVASLLKQVETDFAETARRKGIALKTAVSGELDSIVSDGPKLTQILANLVSNALKFTEKGFVEVRAEPRGLKRWALIVTDSGVGIPREEHDAIFEEFRQGESESHQGHGGTGLGLAIVRKLALLLGGNVSVQSSAGEGATFAVNLPRELSTESPAPPIAATPRVADRRVLVVDDDEATRKLLRFELEPYGLQVLEAPDGARALAIAREQKLDAIILDVVMPRLDGWSTLRALKGAEATRHIPVLVHSVVDNQAFGFALGAFEHLVKPVSGQAIVDALRRAGLFGGGAEVLVADDDPDIRKLLEKELGTAGFRVRTARDGAEALESISRDRPAAVVLDLLMPEPDGFEVLYRIRDDAALRSVPVVVLTGKDLTTADYARLNGSAQRILRKGADMGRLVRDVLASLGETAPAA
jgi:signal transduction histidine kinase/DNA-binding response OmpR family regulator